MCIPSSQAFATTADQVDGAPATVRDLGLTRKQIHEAHQIRDAEMATLHHLQLPARACSLQTRKGGGCGLEFVHAASFGK